MQVLPGFRTKPDTQVLALAPVVTIENTPPVVPTLLTVGEEAALNVKGAAVAPAVFVTVIVPVSVNVLAGAGFSAGEGAEKVSVAPCTVKGTVLLAPDPVVMLTILAPSVAPAPMVKVAVAVVGLRTVRPLIQIPLPPVLPAGQPPPPPPPPPLPETFIAKAPVRLLPVIVMATAVAAGPRTAALGAIVVNVGAGRAMTVNGTALLVPPGAVAVMFLAEPMAVELIVKVAFTWVSLSTEIWLKQIPPPPVLPVGHPPPPPPPPPPPDTLIAVVPVSPLPKRLNGIVCPRTAWVGEAEPSTGPVTEYVRVPVLPPGVVT